MSRELRNLLVKVAPAPDEVEEKARGLVRGRLGGGAKLQGAAFQHWGGRMGGLSFSRGQKLKRAGKFLAERKPGAPLKWPHQGPRGPRGYH